MVEQGDAAVDDVSGDRAKDEDEDDCSARYSLGAGGGKDPADDREEEEEVVAVAREDEEVLLLLEDAGAGRCPAEVEDGGCGEDGGKDGEEVRPALLDGGDGGGDDGDYEGDACGDEESPDVREEEGPKDARSDAGVNLAGDGTYGRNAEEAVVVVVVVVLFKVFEFLVDKEIEMRLRFRR